MCGRFTIVRDLSTIAARYGVELAERRHSRPRYNVAPQQTIPTVAIGKDGKRKLVDMVWGLSPPWGSQVINCRNDKLASNNFYRGMIFGGRRCLIPFDQFYEWQDLPSGGKQPWAIQVKARPQAFAGLWQTVKGESGAAPALRCALITVEPNELIKPVHDRMPAILDDDDAALWLGEKPVADSELLDMVRPYPAERMEMWRVGSDVGNVRNDGAHLVARLNSE